MNKIKQTRLEKGLSVEDMSLILNLDKCEYLKLEDNYTDTNAYLIYKICIILDIDFLQL